MFIFEVATGKYHEVIIERVISRDYFRIRKERYFFNWLDFSQYDVYKIRRKDDTDILGVMALIDFDYDKRIQIKLLAASKENTRKNKQYDRIAGILIAFACMKTLEKYGRRGGVSLVPKGWLIDHYIENYGMVWAGLELSLEFETRDEITNKYILWKPTKY